VSARCSTCTSEHRADVDRALIAGESLRSIAARFDLDHTAVHRHRAAGHVVGDFEAAAQARERVRAAGLLDDAGKVAVSLDVVLDVLADVLERWPTTGLQVTQALEDRAPQIAQRLRAALPDWVLDKADEPQPTREEQRARRLSLMLWQCYAARTDTDLRLVLGAYEKQTPVDTFYAQLLHAHAQSIRNAPEQEVAL